MLSKAVCVNKNFYDTAGEPVEHELWDNTTRLSFGDGKIGPKGTEVEFAFLGERPYVVGKAYCSHRAAHGFLICVTALPLHHHAKNFVGRVEEFRFHDPPTDYGYWRLPLNKNPTKSPHTGKPTIMAPPGGMCCIKCKLVNPDAGPNFPNNTYLCYNCRVY